MRSPLLLIAVAVAWGLSCLHAVQAHRQSPGTSAFRPFWKNRYSERGRRHLRRQASWGALALALTALLFAIG